MPQKTCTWLHRATFKSHLDSVRALLWHGQVLISASDDCTVKLWDCALLLSTVREHLGPVYCVTSVGSEVFTAGAEGVVRQWSIDELLKNNRASHELDLHGDSIWGMISKEGLLVTSSSDRSHKIVCTRNGLQEQVCLQVSNEDTPTAMDWLGDNKFVSGYVRSQRIIVYDLETAKYSGEYSFESKKELSQTNYLLHSPLHQLLATAQEDNLIRLFDTKASKLCLTQTKESRSL